MHKSKLYDMGVSDNVFLRIGVSSGGCSGNTYDATLDDKMNEAAFNKDNLSILF